MKLFLTTTLALVALALAPPALAAGDSTQPCILYPTTWRVGGSTVYTPGYTIPGQDVYFVHTDPITISRGSVYVPYVTTVTTPGVCYGEVEDFLNELLAAVAA